MRPVIKNISKFWLLPLALLSLAACKGKKADSDDDDTPVKSQVPVTVTTVTDASMANYLDLNAISTYMQKNYVKANANGYIQLVNVTPGQLVSKGQLLFTLKTKEAQSIGSSINVLDTTFHFSGINRIKASLSGYITQLSHQKGDYVQDGEQLAVINDGASFAFLMQMPYELRSTLKLNQSLPLTLPDGEKLMGRVASLMPAVDTLAQTQGIVIKVNSTHPIPENLIAKAHIIRAQSPNTQSLPKSAVLSNETQTEFWVMKLINPTTAVKVPVKKGLENNDQVEIVSPKFSQSDKIVVTGNYGLSDTAKVKIVQQ